MLEQFSSTTPLYLGQVHIHIDHDEFLDAIEYGLVSYFESERLNMRQMTTQALLNHFKETIMDESPLAWRLGFILGQFAALLNPDLEETDPRLTYLEALSQKCEHLYHAADKERGTASHDNSVLSLSTSL